jgi:thymidine kinase
LSSLNATVLPPVAGNVKFGAFLPTRNIAAPIEPDFLATVFFTAFFFVTFFFAFISTSSDAIHNQIFSFPQGWGCGAIFLLVSLEGPVRAILRIVRNNYKKEGGTLEAYTRPQAQHGWIEVIVGCMFSGKTEELIKQVRRAKIANQNVQTFKPRIDSRYSDEDVASHDQNKLSAVPVAEARDILAHIDRNATVIAIDEGQFFSDELIGIATAMANSGKRVIIAGLDTDWRGRPFGPMPHLMAIAEVVRKQHAICRVCGGPASRTQRLVAAQEDILVGSTEAYEARCRSHFDPELGSQRLTDGPHHLSLSPE